MYTQHVIHILVQKRVNVYWLFWDLSCVLGFLLSYCFCFSAPNFFPSSQSLRNQYFLFQEFPRGPYRCPPWIPFFLRSSRAAFTILAKRFPLHPCPPQRLTFRQVPKVRAQNPWKISSARAKNNLYGKYLPNSISHPESWEEMVMMMRRRNFMFGLQLLQTFSEPAEWRRICMCKLFLNEQGDVDIKLE